MVKINIIKNSLNKCFYKHFLYSRNLKLKNKRRINNFFWKKQHDSFYQIKKGCVITRKGGSYYNIVNSSRFKLREYQELGFIPLYKK